MPRRETPLIAGAYYHVYNRGNNRQRIYFDEENCLFFLRRLRKYVVGEASDDTQNSAAGAEFATLVAYCLMPNHFHLLIQPHDDHLSRHLQAFAISYTKAINRRYNRTGALFQGAFQSKPVDRDEYLLHLSRYIHLNPVQAGLVKRPEDWSYSSYRDYVGLRSGTLARAQFILDQFSTRAAYAHFVKLQQPAGSDSIAHLLFDDD